MRKKKSKNKKNSCTNFNYKTIRMSKVYFQRDLKFHVFCIKFKGKKVDIHIC